MLPLPMPRRTRYPPTTASADADRTGHTEQVIRAHQRTRPTAAGPDLPHGSPDATAARLREALHEIEQLRLALDHRTVIGQAQGILMERLDLDADRAFTFLRRASNHSNRKLFAVATSVVAARDMSRGFDGSGHDAGHDAGHCQGQVPT